MIEANRRQPPQPREGEDASALLLRRAGARPEVPTDRAARIRHAVRMHWQEKVRRKTVFRRTMAAAVLLAAVSALVLFVRLTTSHWNPEAPSSHEIFAMVERTEGKVRLWPSDERVGTVRQLGVNDAVRVGEWLDTDTTARAALRLLNGTIFRLNSGSRARLLSSTVIELAGGTVYFDIGGESSTDLEVRTPFGTARDIGTQFEASVRDSSLRVRVRTGVVELWRGDHAISARGGTELRVTASGTMDGGPTSVYGPAWEWVSSIAPAFEIDGKPVAAYLEHVCRENGWTLRYVESNLAQEAANTTLYGSIEGLDIRDGLMVAVSASELSYSIDEEGGVLLVSRAATPRRAR